MLAIPMDAPGVDVRPLRQITGDHEFNEVFLDDVAVPADHLIGPENEGWRVANTTLANERGASFIWREQVLHELAVADLVESVPRAARAGRPRRAPAARASRGSTSSSSGSTTPAPSNGSHAARRSARESSLVKLFWADASQRLGRDRGRPCSARRRCSAPSPWAHRLLSTRANSIMGGTSEIQRNIIGERLLGLPREPRG